MNSKLKLLLLICTIACISCGRKDHTDDGNSTLVASKMFFENSKRRSANSKEKKGLVRIYNDYGYTTSIDSSGNIVMKMDEAGCTGFFIRNQSGHNLIATAKHCFGGRPKDWCKYPTSRIEEVFTGRFWKCKEMIVGDSKHDMLILKLEQGQRDKSGDYTLAGFMPKEGSYLQMIGFPSDPYSPSSRGVVTENCWVRKQSLPHPYQGKPEHQGTQNDKVFGHNCSTYGGNSGGPMVVERTKLAVGMPYGYAPGNYSNQSQSKYTYGLRIFNFVKDFKANLQELKINIGLSFPRKIGERNFLSTGIFASDDAWCDINVTPIYNTNPDLTRIKISFSGYFFCPSYKFLDCKKGVCTDYRKKTRVFFPDNNSLTLVEGNDRKTYSRK
jgi:hypothetical protein